MLLHTRGIMANKKEEHIFDHTKRYMTRGGYEVVAFAFANKIMGIIIDKDGSDGVFCSWSILNGKRIGMGEHSGEHIQDLINVT